MQTNFLDALSGISDVVNAHWPPKMPAPPKPPAWTPGMPSIDIVVPHRDDELVSLPAIYDKPLSGGLMMTLTSCERLLAGSRFDYRYYIVSNGNPATGEKVEAFTRAIDYAKSTGHLGKVLYEDTLVSPPTARNIGAAAGTGDLIFFFDNHCLVQEGLFSGAIQTFEATSADSVHVASQGAGMEGETGYHYTLSLEQNFWGKMSPFSFGQSPYRIAVGLHGAFAVKRAVWNEVDGYWDGFSGYGGEECYFDLKLAMLDKTNWMVPRAVHWHNFGNKRGYKRDGSQIVANMLASANIIGGGAWAEKVANSYYRAGIKQNVKSGYGHEGMSQSKQWYRDVLEAAVSRSEARRLWLDTRKQRTLDEQLEKFRVDGVPF